MLPSPGPRFGSLKPLILDGDDTVLPEHLMGGLRLGQAIFNGVLGAQLFLKDAWSLQTVLEKFGT